MTMTEIELPVLLLSLMIPRQGLKEQLMVGSFTRNLFCYGAYRERSGSVVECLTQD